MIGKPIAAAITDLSLEHTLHGIILGSYLLGVMAGILVAGFWSFMRRRRKRGAP